MLVASLYDSYALSEGQHLTELLIGAYHHMALADPPRIDRVSSREAGLDRMAVEHFDLVIVMANTGVMELDRFLPRARELSAETPVVLVSYSASELEASHSHLEAASSDSGSVDGTFLWRGDARLLATIINLAEDARNATPDAAKANVRTIILIEDSVAFYSAYLPLLFTEVARQTDRLMSEGVNLGQRLLRRRLRPRIVHATEYEKGLELYERFRDTALCVISDLRFPRAGVMDEAAGIELFRKIRERDPYIALLLQSSNVAAARDAALVGAGFVNKQSPTLLHDLHTFMLNELGFGDFVFRLADGTEVARAADVEEMRTLLETVPADSLRHHALRNAFSNWLMARTEFALASALRPMKVSDFPSVEDLRTFLFQTFTNVIDSSRRGEVVDFEPRRFRAHTRFVRIGGGSLGGKGRGLAFMHNLMSRNPAVSGLESVTFVVPRSAVVGTEVFDEFVTANNLAAWALTQQDDQVILDEFVARPFPAAAAADLRVYLQQVDFPIAVRSSSLLEDSRHVPAAGIYATHMLPNQGSLDERLEYLVAAMKHVYASTYFSGAKSYLAGFPGRLEDEKMAVVVQEIVGRRHESYLYPDVAGVARSHNVYPMGDLQAEEGIVVAALGLGRTVVDGERAIRFSPRRPRKAPQFTTAEEIVRHAQREFWALDLDRAPTFATPSASPNQVKLGLDVARRHGTLDAVASVYSPENDHVYDGLGRHGIPLVTLAPMRKMSAFPLAEATYELLELARGGLSGHVEIEFAVNLDAPGSGTAALLQVRPQTAAGHSGVQIGLVARGEALVEPCRALGSGRLDSIVDLVIVRRDVFDRSRTLDIASDLGVLNARLGAEGRPYILIGPGRWGTADRWLGIPVSWSQISGARVIVEAVLEDAEVQPSDGAHFFHNVVTLGLGYFTASVRADTSARFPDGRDRIDWAWLESRPAALETPWLRWICLDEPVEVRIDGVRGEGVILKTVAQRAAPHSLGPG